MKGIFLLLLVLPFILWGEEYSFRGKHLIASYYECEENALLNLEELKKPYLMQQEHREQLFWITSTTILNQMV